MNKNAGIFSILAKAQETLDFGDFCVSGNLGNHGAAQPSENSNQITVNTNEASLSVKNFFAAMKPATKDSKDLNFTLSTPVHVDQIEKQQRRITKSEQNSPLKSSNIPNPSATFKRISSPYLSLELGASNFYNTSSTSTTTRLNTGFGESRDTADVDQFNQDTLRNTDRKVSDTTPRPTLMLPTMFSVTKKSTIQTEDPIMPQTVTNEPLSLNLAQVEQSDGLSKPEPLTHSQLLQAMSYLIRTDNSFVKKLHEAYLLSFNEMLTL